MPIGVVGAIPSAYRLYDRAQGDSFYLDFGTAMDMINVLSTATGLGGKMAGRLKWLRVGKGFAIVGLGLDGLGFVVGGAKTLEEIQSISANTNLSPGARKAMIMSAVGKQLQAVGMAVGTKMVESAETIKRTGEFEAKKTAITTEPGQPHAKTTIPETGPVKPTPGTEPAAPKVTPPVQEPVKPTTGTEPAAPKL